MFKSFVRWLLLILFRTRATGLDHFAAAGPRVLVAANHTSYLDALFLWAFLPGPLTFAVNTYVARKWWVRCGLRFADTLTLDQANPLATKTLIAYLKQDRKVVIFPEGRRTTTGALMKIYDGPGLIADKSGATLLPVRIDGPQYTRYSRLQGKVRHRSFPPVRLAVLPPVRLELPA
ncbi:1-acyl-sn-glycerol-3-phosphate acyltransferase, partial [Methylogaea oryzae]